MTIQELYARLGIDYPPTGRGCHRDGIPVSVFQAFLLAEVMA
ncbi:hypothetical protein [Prescottella equi]|nr:hypothetical protein [Prescottella equi]